jgi:hypothetical protein
MHRLLPGAPELWDKDHAMSGYDKLVIVDQYEESHDNRMAVRRACDVMPEYLASSKRPLPDVVAQAVKVAHE